MQISDGYIDLCSWAELDDIGCKGIDAEVSTSEKPVSLLIVRKNGQVYVYRNSCPHTGAPLEWVPDQFLNVDKTFIQCANHEALFRIEDGYCVMGPCGGDMLTAIPAAVVDRRVMIDQAALT